MVVFSAKHLINGSQILVENGIYSRVTVQIEPTNPQPSNCVDFLDKLEVSNVFIMPMYKNETMFFGFLNYKV